MYIIIGKILDNNYNSLFELLPNTSSPAIFDSDSFLAYNNNSIDKNNNKGKEKIPLFHNKLKDFIKKEFDLESFGLLPSKDGNDDM